MNGQNVEQTINFFGGIDTDTEDRFLKNGDFRFAINCLNANNKEASFGAVENQKGDVLITYQLPTGTNKVIGSVEDVRFNTVFYFLYNSNGNHEILRYIVDTNTIRKVISTRTPSLRFMSSRFLNFQDDVRYRIWSANVIYTNNQIILKWLDGYDNTIEIPYDDSLPPSSQQLRRYNPPRGINVTLAENFTNNSTLPRYGNDFGVDNPYVQNQFTDACKAPPLLPPTLEFDSDPTRNVNNFRAKRLVQVRYRYVYYDGEQSVWSPVSQVALPENDENASGVITQNTFVNNLLKITYNTGHSTVYQVELAVRFGNENDWKKFDVIEKYQSRNTFPSGVLLPSYTDTVYNYFNDNVLQAISADEISKPFDYLPIVASSQEYLSNDVISYGNIVEGYDNVSMDVGLGIEFNTQQITDRFSSETFPFTASPKFQLQLTPAINIFVPDDINIVVGSTITITATASGANFTKSYAVTPADISNYPTSIFTAINNLLLQIDPAIVILPPVGGISIGAFLYTRLRYVSAIITTSPSPTITVTNPIQKFTSFKTGALHKFGVVYYDDKLRSGAVNVTDAMRVYIPFQPEIAGLQGATYALQTFQVQFDIRNLAPRWAKYYQIVYGKSNLKKYVQTTIGAITVSGDKNLVNIDPLLVTFQTDNKPTPINYSFEVGDRIRFITDADGVVLSNYIDTRIQAITASAPFNLTIDTFDFTALNIGAGSLVELYSTEKESQVDIYYEIGQVYPVLYDSVNDIHYHGGGSQNQDPLNPNITPARTFLTRGDTYVKPRFFSGGSGIYTPVESDDYSDFYESSDFDYGRTNADINNFSQKRLINGIRWSGKLFENTQQNGLSSFSSLDYTSVKNAAGKIVRLVQVGEVLKIVQEKDTGSLYVGMTVLQSPLGQQNVAAIDTILGAYYPSQQNYGTIFPGSVVRSDRHLYFFDSYSGCFIRDSANGQINISENLFVRDSRQLGEQLSWSNEKDKFDVIAFFDRQKGTYEFTVNNFGDADNIESKTIMFHEASNRWKGQWSYIPEMYGGTGLKTLHFKDGNLWVHGESSEYNNFFGVQYTQKIRFVCNVEAEKAKLFDAITLRTNKLWRAAGANGEMNILIPAWELYPTGMRSRLLENKFRINVAGYNAYFMGDANSPNFPNEVQALMNGRKLQGYIIDITLENDHTDYVRLFSAKISALTMELS